MIHLDPHIFRAYDIRGVVGTQITPEVCTAIGRAFGDELRTMYGIDHPKVAVGRDARTHGPMFEKAIIKGLVEAGCHVLKIGQTPSPLSYFTICNRHLDGSVQITASHNPKEDNGIKLQIRDAEAFAGEELQKLYKKIVQSNHQSLITNHQSPITNHKGSVEEIDAATPYLKYLHAMFPNTGKGLKVVIDTGNGVAGPLYKEAISATGAQVTGLYIEPNGEFPNHPADPSRHDTLKDLQAKVRAIGADIGLAFDGDGDRLGVVDETGTIRTSDEVLLLLSKDHLSRNPKAPIIFTVSNSGALESQIPAWGGTPIMITVGHSFVEHAMREHGSKLGGEQSGHFFCGEDYYGFDDALVAALRVMMILSKVKSPITNHPFDRLRVNQSPITLSSLMSEFPKVYQCPELRPHCPDDRKAEIVDAMTVHFKKIYPVNDLDGARIDFGNGAWAGIRKSNTSPKLSICMEARSEEKLKEVKNIVLKELGNYPEVVL